jgi:hypothetical protein
VLPCCIPLPSLLLRLNAAGTRTCYDEVVLLVFTGVCAQDDPLRAVVPVRHCHLVLQGAGQAHGVGVLVWACLLNVTQQQPGSC